ncbi:STAS domain-containing protein [Ruficoccus amylovorans]|uniref:STAS domain-containing protein n=1 Tax=Ruficoccus amylovorans TaxID=1804625 RepID=A0A842HF14_9BACT|nr:STAS domain-containing protein [Ruficoccus amylovorans]MBC2595113.1 STAS domain-containing protein [Ruficoccus amylovorans]
MPSDVVQFSDGEKLLVCAFMGPLNAERCQQIQEDLIGKIEATESVVHFDMKEVTFASSSFLRIVLTVNKRVGKERLKITNVDPQVKKVFKMSGLWDALGMGS